MDFDRIGRIIAGMMEQNGALYAGGLSAVFVLLLLVIVSRRRKGKLQAGAQEPKHGKGTGAKTIIDDDIDMALDETPSALPSDTNVLAENGEEIVPFELDTSPPKGPDMHMGDGLDAVDDLDDITIPKVGQAPPPQKSRFFSAAWLHKETKPVPPSGAPMSDESAPEDSQIRAAASECARLAEIERKLMALRELYEAGLIAPEVYVLKAREFAAQVG